MKTNKHNEVRLFVPAITRRSFIALGMAWASLPLFAEDETTAEEEPTLCVGEPDSHCGPVEVIRSEADGILTVYTTFEGGTHLNPIPHDTDGWIPGTKMRMAGGWVTSTRPPATFANNPSGNTVATWLSGTTQFIEFDFAEPVFEVFLHYTSRSNISFVARDAAGVVVASVSRPPNSANMSRWDPVSISVAQNAIVSVRIAAASGSGRTGVDDVGYRRKVAIEVPIDVKPGNANEIDPINLKAHGSLPLAVFSTPDFDATTLDPATLQLGDPNLIQIATVVWGNIEDVDGDGLLDVVLHFSATELVDGGALNANTTELLLTGQTTAGQSIFGKDQVRIVGGGN